MNPSAAVDPPQLQPPQPPLAHRPSTSCHRHPEENFTGFCPSCLCERLAVLDHSASALSTSTSSRKPHLATAALRAIFRPSSSSSSSAAAAATGGAAGSTNLKPSTFFPELRRTKSFSASKNEGFSGVFEPQRKSCDVRGRSTLWSLFSQDDDHRNPAKEKAAAEIDQPRASTSSIRGGGPVFKSSENGEIETESAAEEEEEEETANVRENPPGINGRVVIEEPILTARNSNAKPIEEIIEEEDEEEEEEEEEEEDAIVIEPEPEPEPAAVQEHEGILKPMKDHIDLDSQTKKPSSGRDFKEIAGSFWSAASVFSKKLQKWRQKQKMKKRRNGGGLGSATLPVEKPIGRQYRETQSEIADYGFGRRSCDTDPRFSLDAGRISFDDPRYSFDEPRASWDGYLIGRTFPRMPTMLSVVEDAPVNNMVTRSDAQIPVEDPTPAAATTDDQPAVVPGGSIQTRDYYSDSSSRRRKSLDRSNSIRKTAAAVVAEIDELKSSVSSNSKVSPATVDSCPKPLASAVIVPPDRDWRDSNSNSLRDDCSVETFDLGFRDNASSVVASSANGKAGGSKKSRRWGKGWNIWGFIHRRSGNKEEDDDSRYSRANGVERSFSESWPELRGGGERNGGDARMGGGFNNPKLLRSNSSVSWRQSSNGFAAAGGVGSFGSGRKSNVETCSSSNGGVFGRKKRDEFVLERNRSARYSPSNVENGLLRFYLTPLNGSRRAAPSSGGGGGGGGIGGWGKAKTHQAHSIARSVLRLY